LSLPNKGLPKDFKIIKRFIGRVMAICASKDHTLFHLFFLSSGFFSFHDSKLQMKTFILGLHAYIEMGGCNLHTLSFFFFFLPLSHTLSLTLSHSLTHTLSLTLLHTHTLLSLTLLHTLSLTLLPTHTLFHTLSLTLLTQTYTHTP